MNILQVNDRIGLPGGSEEYVPQLSRELIKRGHKVLIVFEEGKGDKKLECRKIGGVGNFDKSKNKNALEELEKIVLGFGADVANAHNIQNSYVLERLCRLVPTVRYIHDHRVCCPGFSKFYLSDETSCPLPFSRQCAINAYTKRCATRRPLELANKMLNKPFELEANRRLPKIIVASNYMKKELTQNGFDPSKIEILKDFVEPPALDGIEYQDFIVFVGRVTVEKGLHYLIEALPMVKESISLIVIGGGPDLERNKMLAKELKLEPRVSFKGWVSMNKVYEFYSKCLLLVFPSIWPEPFGRTGPEAMAHGKPVVGFNVGAVSEWLKDGKNGFLLETKDIKGLAEKINLLAQNRNLAKSLGKNGRYFVAQEMNKEKYMGNLLRIYRETVEIVERD